MLHSLWPGRWTVEDFPKPKAVDLQAAAFQLVGRARPVDAFQRWDAAKEARITRQGHCRQCTRPDLPGSLLCRRHRDKERTKYRTACHARRAVGLCYRCGCAAAERVGLCDTCYPAMRAHKRRQAQRSCRRRNQQGHACVPRGTLAKGSLTVFGAQKGGTT